MSSNPLTSDDLLRCRRVLDEALAADKLDSAQYRTRIRALVVAVDRDDLNALTRDLVPAVGEPGFIDEGHEAPAVLPSAPAAAVPRVRNDTTRAVPAVEPTPGPAPVDSLPSFPDEPDEDDDVEDDALPGGLGDAFPGQDDAFPGQDDAFPGEGDAFPGEEDPHPDGNAQEPEPVIPTETPEEDDQSVTRLVPAVREDSATHPDTITPPALPAPLAGPVPGELVPIRQWSAEVSPTERASSSASTELSPLEHRSTEMSPLEPAPGAALSPAESDDDGDDGSVNRVVVVMVPSAPSPSEPGVTGTSWDALSQDVPEPVGEPVPVAPAPEVDEEDEEDEETVTRISSPIRFDDSEAPTQVLDAIKDLSIFREEPVDEVVEPPQPALPYSAGQNFSGTPADPTAQAAPTRSTDQAGSRMPPPMPEPSEATLAAMPPPTVPPAAGPSQGPWGSYGQDPLTTMPPPPDPAMTVPPPVAEAAYHGSSQFHGQYAPGPVPPSDVSYQPPAPAYGAEPVPQQTPRRRSAWPWVIVTVMVLALLVWIAYLLFLSPQGRRSAAEGASRIPAGVTVTLQSVPVPSAGPTGTADARGQGSGTAATDG